MFSMTHCKLVNILGVVVCIVFAPFRLIDQGSYRGICGKLVAESLGQGQMLEGCTSLAL